MSDEPAPPSRRPPRTDDELRALARDIVERRVLTSRQVPSSRLAVVFLPLALVAPDQLPNDASIVYEYYAEAGPRGIDGWPVFTSMRYLTVEEVVRLNPLIADYEKLVAGFAKPTR